MRKRITASIVVLSMLAGLISPSFPAPAAAAGRMAMEQTGETLRFEHGAASGEARTITQQLGQVDLNMASVPQSVYQPAAVPAASIAPPVLDELPLQYTNKASIDIKGTAKLNSVVTLYYSLDGGVVTEAGMTTVTSDVYGNGTGRFTLPVALPQEGLYEIFAKAKVNGETSDKSNVLKVEIDRSAPWSPDFVAWSNPAYDKIELKWEPSVPNPDIDHYIVVRLGEDGNPLKSTETKLAYYLETDVPEMTYVNYEVYSVDRAGNRSEGGYAVYAASFHKDATLIAKAKTTFESKESFWNAVMSKDGSTVAFVSDLNDLAGSPPPGAGDFSLYAYRLDTKKMIRVADAPDFPSYFGPTDIVDLSPDGRYVVYASREGDNGSALMLFDTVNGTSESLVSMVQGSASSISLSDDANWIVFSSSY